VSFDEDTALSPGRDGAYEGAIAAGWETPRGPLGGYVMAILLRGMLAAVGDEARQPRSLTVHFLRPPTPGPIVVRPVLERSGRMLSTVTARLEQEDRLIALGIGAFAGPQPGERFDGAPMPEVEPADPDRPPLPPLPGGAWPPFTNHLSMQWRFGDRPLTRAERGETGGWMALREPRPVDALSLCVFADAWFPTPFALLERLYAAPTIDLTIHFRAPLPLPDVPILGRFRTTHIRDGYFEEDGQLWTPDGTLVAQSRQLGLLLEPAGG
jgi:acyl-CoA thioesterase